MQRNEYFTKEDINRKVKLPVVNEVLAEFFGIMTGDGCMNEYLSRQAYIIDITGNSIKDLDHHKVYINNIIKELFNLTPSLYFPKGQNTIHSVMRSKAIFYFLKSQGFPPGRKGEISVPEWILGNDLYFKKFICGFFDTDGHLTLKNKEGKKYPVVGLTSISKTLLESIQKFIINYGITSYLGTRIQKDPRFKKELIVYQLDINGKKNINLFFNAIGSNNSRNLLKYKEMGVVGIEPTAFRASIGRSPAELYSHVK